MHFRSIDHSIFDIHLFLIYVLSKLGISPFLTLNSDHIALIYSSLLLKTAAIRIADDFHN